MPIGYLVTTLLVACGVLRWTWLAQNLE